MKKVLIILIIRCILYIVDSYETTENQFLRGVTMMTKKERITEKVEFTIRYVTKELTKQTLIIEGIKDNEKFDSFDMQNQSIEILSILESQAKLLRERLEAIENDD